MSIKYLPPRLFCFALFAGALLCGETARALTPFTPSDIGLLTPYAQFGNSEDESLVTIHGNVGISAGGTLHVFSPSQIYGDVFVDTNATLTDDQANFSNIHGTIHRNQNLAATQNQVFTASAKWDTFTPDQSFSNLNSTQNFTNNVAGTALVVDITNLSLNNANITFSGMGYLVLNVSGSFTLQGTAGILANGGTSPSHIFINYTGTSTLTTKVGDTIDGYLLVTKASATLDGGFVGGIYSGKGKVTLMSGATVSSPPVISQ